jgi:hypothetical protein
VYEEAVKSLASLLPARHLAPPQPIPAQTMLPIEGGGGGGRAADITLLSGQEIHDEQQVIGKLKRCSVSSDQMCDVGDVGDWLGEREEIR